MLFAILLTLENEGGLKNHIKIFAILYIQI